MRRVICSMNGVLPITRMCNQCSDSLQPEPIFLLKTSKGEAIQIQNTGHNWRIWGIRNLNTGEVSPAAFAGQEINGPPYDV